jgi:hypothetical protein
MVDYGTVLKHPFEKQENPQAYEQFAFAYVSPKPARAILGLVGGNEVSLINGNRVDLESDLRGITRPNTDCPAREHQPPRKNDTLIQRKNPKNNITVNITPRHLPTIQPWAYTAVAAPLPMVKETCGAPHKY